MWCLSGLWWETRTVKRCERVGWCLFSSFYTILKGNVTAWSLFCWCSVQISVIRVTFMKLWGWRKLTSALEIELWVLFFRSFFPSLFHALPLTYRGYVCVWQGWGVTVGVSEVSSLAVCEWTTVFPFFPSLLLSPHPFVWARPILLHFSTLKLHSLFPWSVFSSTLSNFYLSLSPSFSLGPLLYPLSPAFLSKVSLSVFLLSCCVAFLFQ